MRHLVLLLAMLLSGGRASFAQSGSEPCPCLGKVCFDMEEAKAIEDTLWDRLSQRERRAIAFRILANRTEAAESAEREAEALRGVVGRLTTAAATERAESDASKAEALSWQLKAKGRGGRGLLIGIPLGGLATYGGLRLFGLVR